MDGKIVSHYKILEKLGEGGMGIVYKAEDTRLKRTVALKFLPRGLESHEPERARFLQEAQAASALNHPNVCTIYDIAEAEGQQFIAMEYVEGMTLREKIAGGKLQTGTAVSLAIQIGEALEEAHGKGIVHRDIKAENIMVTPKNGVKVMDFGLAKLKGSVKLTKATSTVGTLAYMAPEQIQGGEVDARNDIFSFGVVLFEMLTGHLPFRGEHEAAMMYSILNEEPESLQISMPDAPSELLHTVNRALEKDPEERYQTVREMLIDLRRLRKDSARVRRQTLQAEAPPGTKVAPAGTPPPSKKWVWLAALGLMVVAVVLTRLFLLRTDEVRLNPKRTISSLTVPFKSVSIPSVSRDGNWVVFSAEDEPGANGIYWMNVAGGELSRITREESASIGSVDISPDASALAYDCRKYDELFRGVKVVPLQGGTGRTVADTGSLPRWNSDGTRIGYVRVGRTEGGSYATSASGKFEVWSVKPDGSNHRREFIDSLHAFVGRISFCWSPDGASVAWVRNFSSTHGEVMVRELASGRERQLTSDSAQVDEVVWTTSEKVLFVSNKSGAFNVWAVPSEGGVATQVTEGAVPIVTVRTSADARRLVYLQREQIWHIWISELDGENPRQVTFDDVRITTAAFSPDGRHIACALGDVDLYKPEAHLYVMDREGRNRQRLTSGSEVVSYCAWSPDGTRLAYVSRSVAEPEDSTCVYLIQPFRPRAPELLCKGVTSWGGGMSPRWIDNQDLGIFREMKTWRYPATRAMPTQIYKDSTLAIPLKGGNEIVYLDLRIGDFWIVSVDSKGNDLVRPRRISLQDSLLASWCLASDARSLVFQILGRDEIWRLRLLPGSEKERIGTAPSKQMYVFDVSTEGKEILWIKADSRTKLALIENVFE